MRFGGKTGTTNDYTDAWFIGISPSVTCGTWIGFDDRETLGVQGDRGARRRCRCGWTFMKVGGGSASRTRAFSKPNAPKKQLDIPLEHAGDEDGGAKAAPKV